MIEEVLLNLNTSMNESEIREAIKNALFSKLPNIKSNEFEFVKRIKGKILVPTFNASNFSWDYQQIKKLCGQGKIYIRMVNSDCPEIHDDDDTDDDINLPPVPFPLSSSSGGTSSAQSNDKPCCSKKSSSEQIDVSCLEEIFPDFLSEDIREIANGCEDITEAVNKIIEGSATNPKIEIEEKLLQQLKDKTKKRITVSEEYAFEDCLAYYKHPTFDPTIPIRITFEGQPGIDAGGLLRHFYNLVFHAMMVETSSFSLFESKPSLPRVTSETC